MTRGEALEVVRAQAAFARQQSENPYNNSRKELHVRQLFRELAGKLDEALAVLVAKEVPRARRTSRAA